MYLLARRMWGQKVALQQHFRPSDGNLYIPAFRAWVPMSYYMRAYPGPARSDHPTSGVYAVDDTVTTSTYAASHPRVFLISGGGNGEVLSSDAQSWLDAHYHLVDSITDSSVSIWLYVTGPASHTGAAQANRPVIALAAAVAWRPQLASSGPATEVSGRES
jgi:hypothetical protein